MQRLGRKLDESRFDVDLRNSLVYRCYDRLAVGEYFVGGRDDYDIRPREARGDRRLDLPGRVLWRVCRVEEIGKFLCGRVVESECPRRDWDKLQVFDDTVDVVSDLHAKTSRAEDRRHALQPRNVPERHGDAPLQISGVVGDYVCAGGLPELAENVCERRVVAVYVDERHGALRHLSFYLRLFCSDRRVVFFKVDLVGSFVLQRCRGLDGGWNGRLVDYASRILGRCRRDHQCEQCRC